MIRAFLPSHFYPFLKHAHGILTYVAVPLQLYRLILKSVKMNHLDYGNDSGNKSL